MFSSARRKSGSYGIHGESNKNEFNRQYVFALMDYHFEKDTWLFGGIYKVLSRQNIDQSHSYEVQLEDKL